MTTLPTPPPTHAAVEEICVRDPVEARRTLLISLITSLGARLAASDGTPVEAYAHHSVAVVAVETNRREDPGIDAARTFRQRGYRILSVATGARAWPLSSRCHVLAAGAHLLLDPEESDFGRQFTCALADMLREEALRLEETERVTAVLRELGVVGASRAMIAVFRQVMRAAQLSDLPVLLSGETGTGKELLARALHRLDPVRKAWPFVALNCAALPAQLAEAELFGYRRGAFTDADRDRLGLFRAANKGVLFLDEIGELDLSLQAKLLRVLQDGRVLALGEDRDVAVNVRVIAATNRDLKDMLARGAFRPDLFHRLNVVAIHVPPLRERRDDLGPLVRHLVSKHAAVTGAAAVEVNPEFILAIEQLPLDGNAREVENLIRRVLTDRCLAGSLGLADLPHDVLQELSCRESGEASCVPVSPAHSMPGPLDVLAAHRWNLSNCLEHYERLLLTAALESAGGNHTRAGRMLGITPRTIYNKVRKLRIASCA
jgi:transcriptional regulator with GAF, ATPase, and Fis domain